MLKVSLKRVKEGKNLIRENMQYPLEQTSGILAMLCHGMSKIEGRFAKVYIISTLITGAKQNVN